MAEQFMRAFALAGGEIVLRRTIRTPHAARARAAGSTTERAADIGALPIGLDSMVRSFPHHFDLLFYGGSFDGAALLKTMRTAGLPQLFAAGDGCWDVRNFVDPAAAAASAGEGVLVLAATLAVGRMQGSVDFASRYTSRYGRIGNYALNSYDSMRLLIDAITLATRTAGRVPDRASVIAAIQRSTYQGLAYRDPVRWDEKGDNLASLTALNIVCDGRFEQIAEIAAT
jgi:branched-chain amino acid transport system substrate-binding protein